MIKTKLKETETLELKKSTSELKEAVISMASILNKHNQGKVYFGIKDNGEVVGQNITGNTIREISQVIASNIEPKIFPKIIKEDINKKSCVYVQFEGNNIPYFAYGRAYIRVGDENRQLSAKELEDMFIRKNKDELRWDNKYSDKPVSKVNIGILKDYIKRANLAKRIDFKFKDLKTTLKKLDLIKDGKLLRAAEVLFCNESSLEVQLAIFAGTDRVNFLDIKSLRGNLFKLLEQSELYVKEHINWRAEIKDFKRVEIPEIPVAALREALVNSLSHRDYWRGEGNQIAIFKDRVEIYNPGKFPEGASPQDFIKGEEKSILRNPLIATVLYYSKDIEKWGSGLKRIYEECKANNVKVEFKVLKSGFSVVFYRSKIPLKDVRESVLENVLENALENLLKKDTSELKIFNAIKKNKNITIKELSKALKLDERTIRRNIAKLKQKNLIERIGPDKGGYWEIK